MLVTYISACFDSSGYAEAARNNIAALSHAGVEVNVLPLSFEQNKTQKGKLETFVASLVSKERKGKIQIVHLTPQNFKHFVKPDMYNIGYTAWETSRLPLDWVPHLNIMNEIWVPSEHNVQVCKDSGVNVPVFCMPHTFQEESIGSKDGILENIHDDDFVFYSIFQWLERKNPTGLIRAYATEFSPNEKVVLVIKTFLMTPGAMTETDRIRKSILDIKKTLYLPDYPRMILISSLLTRDQIYALHHRGDCYVSLHRCEGFGIPLVEAMMQEKPVITTSYGGPSDFIQHDKTGFLVKHMLTPVAGMPWNTYTGHMNWAEPDLLDARRLMREVFENQKKAKQVGKAAKAWVLNNLNWESVGNKMRTRLEQINA